MKLAGRIALVTGAQQGIGAAIAVALAEEGADVALTWLDDEPAAERVAARIRQVGRRVHLIRADVARLADIDMMVTDTARVLGAADILVNNAGVYPRVKLLEMRECDWDYVLDINLKAGCFATIAFVKALMSAGKAAGSVINISSQAIRGAVRGVHYSASKGGVVSMTRAMALELAPHNIRVNAIAPGTDRHRPAAVRQHRSRVDRDGEDHSARRQDAVARSDRTNRRVPRFRGCQCHYRPGPPRERRDVHVVKIVRWLHRWERLSVETCRAGTSCSVATNIVFASARLSALSRTHGLRPPLQGGFAPAVQPIHTALGTLEPTINVAEQNAASLRCNRSKITRSAWARLQQCSAHKSLLPIGRHDRLSRQAARRWIANAPCMLAEQSRAATLIRPWPIRSGLGQHLYSIACHVDGHEPKADQSAETAHAGIPVASASGCRHGQPNLICTAHALYGLQQQIEAEAPLHHFHDHEPLRLPILYSDGIAAVHLAFTRKPAVSRNRLTAG